MLSRRGPGQQQDGDIAATDQQQQSHRPEEQVERPAKFFDELFVEAYHAKLRVIRREVPRRFLRELLDQRLERGIGLRMRYAWLEAYPGVEGLDRIPGDFQRKIDIAVAPCEARTGHSDYGVVLPDQLHCLADHRGIAVKV